MVGTRYCRGVCRGWYHAILMERTTSIRGLRASRVGHTPTKGANHGVWWRRSAGTLTRRVRQLNAYWVSGVEVGAYLHARADTNYLTALRTLPQRGGRGRLRNRTKRPNEGGACRKQGSDTCCHRWTGPWWGVQTAEVGQPTRDGASDSMSKMAPAKGLTAAALRMTFAPVGAVDRQRDYLPRGGRGN